MDGFDFRPLIQKETGKVGLNHFSSSMT